VACRTARQLGAAGVVALAFPLHPPGRPVRSRQHELTDAGVPTLVIQGERDAFGAPDEFPVGTSLVPVPGADHGFAVRRSDPLTRSAVLDHIVDSVANWVATLVRSP
jgi:predicted alpha/beta-hydrolase family hydrolase